MLVSDFNFVLPEAQIAQVPIPERTASRLLILDRVTGGIREGHVADLPAILRPGDVVVLNNTRVFKARLLGHRTPSGGAVECLLLSHLGRDLAFRLFLPTSHPLTNFLSEGSLRTTCAFNWICRACVVQVQVV